MSNRVSKRGDNNSASFTRLGSSYRGVSSALYRRLLGRQTIHKNLANTQTSAIGGQNVIQFSCLAAGDLGAIKTACNAGAATENDVLMFLGTMKHNIKLKNQSSIAGKLTIYDLVYRRTPLDAAYDSPTELWNKGYVDAGAGATQASVVGNTPFGSPEFKTYIRVHKVTTVYIEPGQTHEHTMVHRLNRLVHSTRFANASSTYFGGLTTVCMVVWHGGIVHEGLTPATVTVSSLKLDYIQTLEYNFAYLSRNTPSYTTTDNLVKTIVDPNHMGEDQDVDANVVSA